MVLDPLMTFTAPREISIVHYKLGAILWVLRILIISYVVTTMVFSFTHLEIVDPVMARTGWSEQGTFYGKGKRMSTPPPKRLPPSTRAFLTTASGHTSLTTNTVVSSSTRA